MSLEGILANCLKAEKTASEVKENILGREGQTEKRVMKMECEV